MIRARSLSFLLAFLVLGAGACGDDDDDNGTGVDIMARISGSWQAQSFTYENDANESQSVDVINTLGGALNVTIQESGAFTGTVSIPGVTPQPVPVSGTLDVDGNDITVDFSQQTEGLGLFSDFDATYTLTNNNNTFTWVAADVTFDFDLTGPNPPVPAELTVVLARTSS